MLSKEILNFQKLIEGELHTGSTGKQPAELYEPITYILGLGGKRIRPVMVLLSCNLFGGSINQAIPVAHAVEYFHNFTLIHDDIMDQAPFRRSQPTIHEKWNANIAILSGDTMFALAIQHLCKLPSELLHQILPVFIQTAVEVCEGQQFDMNFEKRQNVELDDYIEMIRLKTAVLLASSLQMGAIVSGASAENTESIRLFGINVGIAFQIKDDWLDLYGDAEKFGKVKGGDIMANKKTFLFLKALQLGNDSQKAKLTGFYSDEKLSDQIKVDLVSSIFDELNIKEIALNEAEKFYQMGISQIEKLDISEDQKKGLYYFTDQLMNRDH